MQTTLDTFFEGKLLIRQPKSGYRSSIDALLLTHFAVSGRHAHRALDIGAGCGIIGLALLLARAADSMTAIEVQRDLASIAEDNAQLNQLGLSYTLFNADVRDTFDFLSTTDFFDLIVMNPPFWRKSSRLPSHPQRQIACHELFGTIDHWLDVASRLLSPRKGRICIVFPAQRLNALFISLQHNNLSCHTVQMVHSLISRSAELVLIEARRGKSGNVNVLSPLILKNPDGTDSSLARRITSGSFSDVIARLPDKRVLEEPTV